MSYEDRDPYGMYKVDPAHPRGPGPQVMGAATLIGDSVVNEQGEALGDIKEIMLDMRSGQVAYAVLSFGGILGLGEKLFAVPWNTLRLDIIGRCFVLGLTKAQLETAPGFDKDAWPNMADSAWAHDLHAYYATSVHPPATHP